MSHLFGVFFIETSTVILTVIKGKINFLKNYLHVIKHCNFRRRLKKEGLAKVEKQQIFIWISLRRYNLQFVNSLTIIIFLLNHVLFRSSAHEEETLAFNSAPSSPSENRKMKFNEKRWQLLSVINRDVRNLFVWI